MNPREGFSDFGELLCAVEGATEVIPEASGVVRIEAHRALDPVDPFFRPPQPGQKLALLNHDDIIVGIER